MWFEFFIFLLCYSIKQYDTKWDPLYPLSIIMIQVKHCEVCQKSKRKFDKPAAPLHPIPVSDTWNKLGIDLIELTITPRGNRYVITLINGLFFKVGGS